MRAFDISKIGAGLAFAAAAAELSTALDDSRAVVVSAAPGSGKTTLVPPLVANRVSGRVIVTQPRRVAARSAARRLAFLDGTGLGDHVGFSVRGERHVGAATRIEMVTPGILLRRLLADPEVDGVDAVILDEVHERALDTDLLIGLLGEVRELREDLVLVAMSATLDADRFAALLGGDSPAPVVSHPAVAYPLEERWAPARADRLDQRGVTPAFLHHVATTVVAEHSRALSRNPSADVLVFAPGAREVGAIAREAAALAPGAEVLQLHAQVSALEQDRAVAGRAPGDRPRIIVATSIAESSLTVPGVTVVVDTCLSRVPRRDAARGMTGLVTVPTSRAAAVQRAGRAARLGPGTVIRCVNERTYAAAPAFPTPEILTSDLTEACLLLACWGSPGGRGLRLPDPLPTGAAADAQRTLESLGATAADGRATARGERLARVPADPRLARALFDGVDLVGAQSAAEIIALVAGEIRVEDADLSVALRALRDGRHPRTREWQRETRRFRGLIEGDPGAKASSISLDVAVGTVVALAYPERIARRVGDADGAAVFQLASGTRAGVSGALASAPWLAVAEVGRAQGRTAAGTGAVIRSAAAIDEAVAAVAGAALLTDRTEASFVDGRIAVRRDKRLGDIVLSSTPMKARADDDTRAAVLRALERDGLATLSWSDAAVSFRGRLALLHRELGAPWPDVSDAALAATVRDWLGPEITALAAGASASRVDVLPALRRLLPWPEAARLDELVPERIGVPSGSTVRLTYPSTEDAAGQPVASVKLQEMFGLTQTPRVVDGRVPVLFHLLSPAGRPVAVTADLASFWAGPYAQVRAEMRGRYPKHPWPEDPHTHVATAYTKRRLAGA
ncbi:ATP-dependent helicase HrpB [Microbacterium sp. ZW T5_56]|uniref:ATP-dependent helicase HrpB n=1 Tax=Microbacterium sp. ZW T5_56 TaxID=3378081 RepID=UPI003851A1AF